ncbi:MAG: hypothetical protein KGL74_04050 [Elusimicrobia bacterium]|nr:hypothetical protein [Elusimicrobiota bacterium]MDE2510273.1 hypothetical protein [Elusimicrobiota bacterium]
MKAAIAPFLFAGLLFTAASAFAQSNPHVAYQNALLARGLAPADKALCDARAGAGPDYDACRVTRLFLADIASGRDQGFPPMTDIKYASKAETSLILDRMTKYGG